MNAPNSTALPPIGTAPRRLSRRFLRLRLLPLAALPALVLCMLLWAALAPLPALPDAQREQPFEIPNGTYARRMAGDGVQILPDTIHLQLAVRDVLLLKNADEVPQVFGPVLIMPGQSFRLPFEKASTYSFACSAHASGQMTVIVADGPAPGWPRLHRRMRLLRQGSAWL